MHYFSACFFLPIINAIVTVQIHRNSVFESHFSCGFIKNVSLSFDASIQSCIWECVYEYNCQTAVFYHNEKLCKTFIDLCQTGYIQSSGNISASVICYRKDHAPTNVCSSTPIVSQTTLTTEGAISNETIMNTNLVRNGDAENGTCQTGGNVTHPTKWNYNGTITQVIYNASYLLSLQSTDPGPSDRGKCYFYGQQGTITSMWQFINITTSADHLIIDNQTMRFNFSAWLGGFLGQDDNAVVSLMFLDNSNNMLGNRTKIGPILAHDRGNETKLVFRSATGLVPIRTRSLHVFVKIQFSFGSLNNGYVDNIAVVLYK
ncbi:hypothetical protein I4U23_004274 [Adineta vaga]|nr:hypothetical protein I4U23_004274 [Adineta vaga]